MMHKESLFAHIPPGKGAMSSRFEAVDRAVKNDNPDIEDWFQEPHR
jgi:hypothetical protein